MRPASHTGAPPELNPEGSPRRDADAGGGTGLPRAGKPGSWVQQQAERWAQLPRTLDARLVPPLEAREGCRKPRWPRVGRVWGRCPVSAPVSAGVWQLPAPAPGRCSVGTASVSHPGHWSRHTRGSDTVLTQDTGVISQTLEAEACRSRKQGCFSQALHPARGTHPHPGEGTGGRR